MVTVVKLVLNVVGIGGGAKGSSSKRKENCSGPSTMASFVILTIKHCLRVALSNAKRISKTSGFQRSIVTVSLICGESAGYCYNGNNGTTQHVIQAIIVANCPETGGTVPKILDKSRSCPEYPLF
jgi:hypothetical protein